MCRGAQNLSSSGVCRRLSSSVATVLGPEKARVHERYSTVRGSKKWQKGDNCPKCWVTLHKSPFGATLPCGCYLVFFCDRGVSTTCSRKRFRLLGAALLGELSAISPSSTSGSCVSSTSESESLELLLVLDENTLATLSVLPF